MSYDNSPTGDRDGDGVQNRWDDNPSDLTSSEAHLDKEADKGYSKDDAAKKSGKKKQNKANGKALGEIDKAFKDVKYQIEMLGEAIQKGKSGEELEKAHTDFERSVGVFASLYGVSQGVGKKQPFKLVKGTVTAVIETVWGPPTPPQPNTPQFALEINELGMVMGLFSFMKDLTNVAVDSFFDRENSIDTLKEYADKERKGISKYIFKDNLTGEQKVQKFFIEGFEDEFKSIRGGLNKESKKEFDESLVKLSAEMAEKLIAEGKAPILTRYKAEKAGQLLGGEMKKLLSEKDISKDGEITGVTIDGIQRELSLTKAEDVILMADKFFGKEYELSTTVSMTRKEAAEDTAAVIKDMLTQVGMDDDQLRLILGMVEERAIDEIGVKDCKVGTDSSGNIKVDITTTNDDGEEVVKDYKLEQVINALSADTLRDLIVETNAFVGEVVKEKEAGIPKDVIKKAEELINNTKYKEDKGPSSTPTQNNPAPNNSRGR